MRSQDLVLVQGVDDTKRTLARWNERPWTALRPWLVGSVGVAVALLGAVWVVAKLSTPDPTPLPVEGFQTPPTAAAVIMILARNSLVLALHGMACVAGFIAGSALPQEAARRHGVWRRVHDTAGPAAIAFVGLATTFSLATQAYVIGGGVSTLAAQLHLRPAVLLLALVPHALPELTALFLPLAAWLIASRRGHWHELLAATFVTVALAVPTLVIAAVVEVFVSPHLLAALASS